MGFNVSVPSKQINMAYTSTTALIIVYIICLFSISRAVRNLNSFNDQDDESSSPSSVSEVGICSLLIETQGYICEEHTVCIYSSLEL